MSRIEFIASATKAQKETDGEEELFEFTIAEQDFSFRLPSTSQATIVVAATRSSSTEFLSTVYDVFESLEVEGTNSYRRLRRLVNTGVISLDLLLWGDEQNDSGILASLMEQTGGRPTSPSSDSSTSQKSAGRRSTGRSPGKGSTLSDSPSTDS